MDGALAVTVISSSVVVGGAIAGGFWRVIIRIGKQDKSIGQLDGKIGSLEGNVKGMNTTMQNFQGQLNGIDGRMGRLDERINGLVTDKKEKG